MNSFLSGKASKCENTKYQKYQFLIRLKFKGWKRIILGEGEERGMYNGEIGSNVNRGGGNLSLNNWTVIPLSYK